MHRLRKITTKIALMATVMGCAMIGSGTAHAQANPNQLAAAVVFNIVRFVTFPTRSTTLPLCVAKTDPMAASLAQLHGRASGSGTVEVRLVDTSALYSSGCRVVYAGSTAPRIQAGVLVIGDSANFVDNGGTVGLERIGRQTLFAVNSRSARNVNITISSQLMRLATRVL